MTLSVVCLPFPPWITCLEFRMLPLKALWVFRFDPRARWWSFQRTLFRVHDFRHLFLFHTHTYPLETFPYSKPCQEGIDSHSRTPSHTRIPQRTVNGKMNGQPESKISDCLKSNVEGIWEMKWGLERTEGCSDWRILPMATHPIKRHWAAPSAKPIPVIPRDTMSLALACMPHPCQPR